MTVNELIQKLQDMPLNSKIEVCITDGVFREPMPEMVWDDVTETYQTLV